MVNLFLFIDGVVNLTLSFKQSKGNKQNYKAMQRMLT